MDEKIIRKNLIEQRASLKNIEVESASKKVEELLFSLEGIMSYNTYFVYKSFRGEIDTDAIILRLKKAGKRVLFPLVKDEIVAIESTSDCFEKDKFGVSVPKFYKVFNGAPDVVITPLVACDKNLNRLGFGKGYYDRFFAKAPCLKVGICHDFQIVDALCPKSWDIPLDVVITDKRVIYRQN